MTSNPRNIHELVELARATAPDIRSVENGFERRVRRRIESEPIALPVSNLFSMAWKAAPVCAAALAAVMVLTWLHGAGADSATSQTYAFLNLFYPGY
ncbi:MAG: hypothetical protein AB7D07_02520 [Desulfovibrionaceae bacterium]|jgi:hypothetical protein